MRLGRLAAILLAAPVIVLSADTTGVEATAAQKPSLPAIVLSDTLIRTEDYWDFNQHGIYVRREGSQTKKTFFLVTSTGVCEELDFRGLNLRREMTPVPTASREMKKYAAMRVSSVAAVAAGGAAFVVLSLVPRILLIEGSDAAYMRPRYAADAVGPCFFVAGIVLGLTGKPVLRKAVEVYNAGIAK